MLTRCMSQTKVWTWSGTRQATVEEQDFAGDNLLFSYHILASFISHPYLVYLSCGYIYPGSYPESLFCGIPILRIRDGQTATAY